MGLVQSQSRQAADAIQVDGFHFTIAPNLQRFIQANGELLIDFKSSFWGDDFTVRLSGQTASCC